jgi:hypothetical protein
MREFHQNFQMSSHPTRSAPDATQRAARHKFTPEEDLQLRSLVESLGTKRWDEIAVYLPGRSGRQCRDRYKNYLIDSLIVNPWTPEEDAILLDKFHQIGPKWVEIGRLLSGRSGNNVKNRWHKHLCKLGIGRPGSVEKMLPTDPKPSTGMAENDWSQLFANGENPMQFACSWSRGSSVGEPLF